MTTHHINTMADFHKLGIVRDGVIHLEDMEGDTFFIGGDICISDKPSVRVHAWWPDFATVTDLKAGLL